MLNGKWRSLKDSITVLVLLKDYFINMKEVTSPWLYDGKSKEIHTLKFLLKQMILGGN
jgi:hypothetical protein